MKNILLAAALLASSSAVLAGGVYAGGSVGYTTANIDCAGTDSCSNNGVGTKVFGGYQINKMFAVETSYFNLGKPSATVGSATVDLKTTGIGVRGLIFFPFDEDTTGFAALGINRIKSEANATSGTISGSIDTTSTKPSFALGVDGVMTPKLKMRYELESTRIDAPAGLGTYRVNNFSIGLLYSF